MGYLLGLDIGTSGVKGLLIEASGAIVASHTEAHPLSAPQPGWTEQNPDDWWDSTCACIRKVLSQSGVDAGALSALSFSGQMHSSVFLDKEMRPIRPAILWSDTRTTSQCREIERRAGGLPGLIQYVSNPALEGFTAPKLLWLRENEPENYKKLHLLLLPKDYIRYRLTGEIHMDVSDGAGTLLMNVVSNQWSEPLLDSLDLSAEILPPLVKSIHITGAVSAEAADATGLTEGTPVAAGGADNACGAVGAGIGRPGRVMVSIGTSGVVVAFAQKPTPDPAGRMHLFNHSIPDQWYNMGVMLSAGMSYSWLKEGLLGNRLSYDDLNEAAGAVAAGCDGLVFLPYLFGERTPHADADARGVFFGISGSHETGHFARAVMEGVAFGLRDSLELIRETGASIEEIRAIGGGAKSPVWRRILADVFGQEIAILNIEEGPAFGAALIAGVGAGVYKDFAEAEEGIIQVIDRIAPNRENSELYERYYALFRELYPALKQNYIALSRIIRR